jgi:chlorocatechol 1,2-dioxygenase
MNKRCEGVHSALVHADRREEGVRVIENNLKLAPAVVAHAATAAG